MRDKIQDNLNLISLKSSPYLYPYVMMLYNQLILVPGDEDYEEYTDLSNQIALEVIANGDLAQLTLEKEFESFKDNMYRNMSDELEQYKEANVVSTLLAIFKSVVILQQPGQIEKAIKFLFDDEEEAEFSEHGKAFFTDVMMTDDGLMIDLMNLLISIDRQNLSELDFVHVFVLYLERVNYDDELFLSLLLECEGAKFLYFLVRLFKTDNIVQRFENWSCERGRFRIWTFKLMNKIDKNSRLFHFNPKPLIRKMLTVLE